MEPGGPAEGSASDWARLWDAARPALPPHPIISEDLGQYAALLRRAGSPAAAGAFPAVVAHLATGCAECRADLAELLALLDE